MRRVIVLGCGKSKLLRPAPARELYTGSLFRAGRRYAEALGVPWVILSALHGIVRPEQLLEPYDVQRGRGIADLWGARVAGQLRDWVRAELGEGAGSGESVEVVCLAGETYAGPLEVACRKHGLRVVQPLAGYGLGPRLAWLSEKTRELRTGRTEACAAAW